MGWKIIIICGLAALLPLGAAFVILVRAPRHQYHMQIESTAFTNNGPIPTKYTCEGEDSNPPLRIKDIPAGTKELVLIVDDPDAPQTTPWLHWLVWKIPATTTEIAENGMPAGAMQGKNGSGGRGYEGPCPPAGAHRYFFKLYAIDSPLEVAETATRAQVEGAMEGHIVGEAQLVGIYERKTQ